jgi:hypothetical protein
VAGISNIRGTMHPWRQTQFLDRLWYLVIWQAGHSGDIPVAIDKILFMSQQCSDQARINYTRASAVTCRWRVHITSGHQFSCSCGRLLFARTLYLAGDGPSYKSIVISILPLMIGFHHTLCFVHLWQTIRYISVATFFEQWRFQFLWTSVVTLKF